MLINDNKKLIFVRIPKTASGSINDSLIDSGAGWKEIDVEISKNKWHLSSYELKGLKDFNDYRIVAVCRNPWDRMVSLYFFLLKRTEEIISRKSTDAEWLSESVYSWACRENINIIQGGFNNFYSKEDPAQKCCSYWVNENHPGGFKWLRYENILEIENFLDIKLYHKNKTSHLHYSNYYNEETKELIRRVNIEDIKKFNYKFEEP